MINIQKNISLSKYTSFKIGGAAKFFCAVENNDEIKEALEFAVENKLEVFVLGGGSNLLISDEGFDGMVLRIANCELRIANEKIICGAGVPLAKLVSESVKNNLTGLEWAAGIPGTVGGAVVNNAGANNNSMMDVMEEVEVLETTPPSPPLVRGGFISPLLSKEGLGEVIPLLSKGVRGISKLNNKDCDFSYRDSIFKKEKKYIIISAVLKLSKGNQDESKKIISGILKSRKEKQPLEYPSAGSVFKNPVVDDEHFEKLIKKYPAGTGRCPTPLAEGVGHLGHFSIPAGWLIEKAGLKNKKIGGAMVSEKHCNFIINMNNAKAEDVVILISLIKQKVRTKFGIQLREEIEYLGF